MAESLNVTAPICRYRNGRRPLTQSRPERLALLPSAQGDLDRRRGRDDRDRQLGPQADAQGLHGVTGAVRQRARRFDEMVWPALAKQVPAFAAVRLTSARAGYYDFNTFDQNGIVGPHAELDNLVLANGFSGHGVMHSPAAGRAVAEILIDSQASFLDVGCLGLERFANGKLLRETAFI